MQQFAASYGMTLTRAQAQDAIQSQQQRQQQWEPQNWDEVLSAAEQRAEQRIMQRLAPIIGNVQKLSATNIEKQLNEIDPGWRQWEDDMRRTLQEHPTMVNDVSKLYRLSVPETVLESKATQAALAKFQSKADSARVSATGSVSRSTPAPKAVSSFAEAVEEAKAAGRKEGRARG